MAFWITIPQKKTNKKNERRAKTGWNSSWKLLTKLLPTSAPKEAAFHCTLSLNWASINQDNVITLTQLDCPCLMDVLMFCSWLQIISSGKLKTEHSLVFLSALSEKYDVFLNSRVKIQTICESYQSEKWGVCDQWVWFLSNHICVVPHSWLMSCWLNKSLEITCQDQRNVVF